MREILFRGKHVHVLPQNEYLDGVWVEGYLAGPDYIVPKDGFDKLVDPNTVGQFTGMVDWQGKKIFEGDVVYAKFNSNQRGFNFKVVFDDSTGSFMFDNGYLLSTRYRLHELILRGNIWDNPELLEVEDRERN